MKTRGRKVGSLIRCTCRICAKVELARGSGKYFRCTGCRDAGIQCTQAYAKNTGLGKQSAQGVVAQLIRDCKLDHPSKHRCVDCGCNATEYEHRDYNKPAMVEPICRSCNLKRGPAIPRIGSMEKSLANGFTPYSNRRSVEKLFAHAGLYFPRLQSMPAKLDKPEWAEIIPVWTKHQMYITNPKA